MEETGYRALEVQVLGKYAVNGNQGCGNAYLCTAKGCVQVAEPRSGDLERMDLKVMSIADVDAAVRGGHISVLPHLALWGSVRA
jgi:ADP-ribose pyrophosphatase